MRKVLLIILLFMIGGISLAAQMRFSATANVYNDKNNQKVGTQYIAANFGSNGVGTMTLGSLTMKAAITNSKRDNHFRMTAYSATLRSSDGKTVDVVITRRDEGTYSVLVYYADGTLRYDFTCK